MLMRSISSPWGTVHLFARNGRLSGVQFEDDCAPGSPDKAAASGGPSERADRRVLDEAAAQLCAYVAGRLVQFDLPLEPQGTPFQASVWAALQHVAFGTTVSYAGLAARAGRPAAVRAVGGAVGRNPWVIVVPCHRVLAAGSALGGFSSGLERKRALLRHERIPWHERGKAAPASGWPGLDDTPVVERARE